MKSRYRVSLASLFLNLVSSTTLSKNDTHYHSDPADFMKQFFEHNGAHGTGLAREETDPHYWASNSEVPTMPKVNGFMGSHGVYRHFTVMEQTAVMIGEPKHGVWRMQDDGTIREYLSAEAEDCWKESDGDVELVSGGSDLEKLRKNYSACECKNAGPATKLGYFWCFTE